jgi:hypothetical protein
MLSSLREAPMKFGTLATFARNAFSMSFARLGRESRSCAEIATAIMSGRWLSIFYAVD